MITKKENEVRYKDVKRIAQETRGMKRRLDKSRFSRCSVAANQFISYIQKAYTYNDDNLTSIVLRSINEVSDMLSAKLKYSSLPEEERNAISNYLFVLDAVKEKINLYY